MIGLPTTAMCSVLSSIFAHLQLGHASVAQTDTYLNGTRDSRREAVLRAEQCRLGIAASRSAG